MPLRASAADPPLTLAEAQRRAVASSRQVAAHDHAVAAAREMVVAAGQRPDPVLTVGIDNLPVEGADRFSATRDGMTMRRIGVMQEITRADKLRLRAERFEKEVEKGLAERDAAIAVIERDTAQAWFDRYYAERMAALVAAQSVEAKLEIEAAQAAYRAGRGSQADVLAARGALVALDDLAADIRRRIGNARLMLARWIGEAADLPLADRPSLDTLALDRASLEAQLAHHPQLAVAAKQRELAQSEARLAEANRKADWSVELMFNQRGPAYDNMVSVAVSIPLPWDRRNRQDRELASKLALAEQARARHEDAARAHGAEVRALINEWDSSRERAARLQRDLVPLAGERTQAALAAYRGNRGTLAEVLMARRNELEARMQLLQREMETARLWTQLNFLAPRSGASGAAPRGTANGAVK
ncbi:MAG TPA: TolC family protein [Paucimonas sp.]|nr:TolC family protein [Paucimonas sp.]